LLLSAPRQLVHGGPASWHLLSGSISRYVLQAASVTGHPGLAGLGLASLAVHIASVTVQKKLLQVIFFGCFP